ncbi:hypothetical protein KY336_04245 [Candidatus Woesearchaeota archaeon]|nr:hypothetical protein [Candidatus Woesearchaeota archaeon]
MARLVWVIQTATKTDGKLKGRIKQYKRTRMAQFEVPYSTAYKKGNWVEVTRWGGTAANKKAVAFKKLK